MTTAQGAKGTVECFGGVAAENRQVGCDVFGVSKGGARSRCDVKAVKRRRAEEILKRGGLLRTSVICGLGGSAVSLGLGLRARLHYEFHFTSLLAFSHLRTGLQMLRLILGVGISMHGGRSVQYVQAKSTGRGPRLRKALTN